VKRLTGEPNDSDRRRADRRSPSFDINSHPNFGRGLRGETVEAQGRQQADYAPGHFVRRFEEGQVFGDPRTSGTVQSPPDPLEQTPPHQSGEVVPWNPESVEIFRADYLPFSDQRKQLVCLGLRHMGIS
jgi:hypothetical protein